jgi:hypothetical protein
MKNYLAKPFLVLFISLVIYIPHSLHSLSNSHILHKRMEIAVEGKNACEASELSKLTTGGKENLGFAWF